MDHLKDSIWTRSFAEKDPKIEYKREGFRMFNEMLESIEDRVTDIIFRVHLEAGACARSIWQVSQTSHDQVGQFAGGRGAAGGRARLRRARCRSSRSSWNSRRSAATIPARAAAGRSTRSAAARTPDERYLRKCSSQDGVLWVP